MRVLAMVNWGLGLELVRALQALPVVEQCTVIGQCDETGKDPWRNVVREFCMAEGIAFHTAGPAANGQVADLMEQLGPDLAVTHAWPLRLPASVYGRPALGTLNFHASLLPRHRGRSPHLAALEAGDTVTGLTSHLVDDGLDTGPIVAQASCPIVSGEGTESLIEKIKLLAAPLLAESIGRLLDPAFSPQPQGCDSRAN